MNLCWTVQNIREENIYIVDLVKYIHIKEPKTLTISISLWAMTVRDYSASVYTPLGNSAGNSKYSGVSWNYEDSLDIQETS